MTDNELTLTYIDGLMRGREEAAELLAATQAREADLRVRLDAVLEFIDPRNYQTHCECDPSVGYQCAACSWPAMPEIAPAYALLARPADNTALLARLKAERERVVRELAYDWLPNIKRREMESSQSKADHNRAVDDCIKHVLSYSAHPDEV